jgi:hypothetical protein
MNKNKKKEKFEKQQKVEFVPDPIEFIQKVGRCERQTCKCHPIKQKLFTTEDGIVCKDHRTLYTVNKRTFKITSSHSEGIAVFAGNDTHTNWYYDKGAAEEYILMHKPCLSVNDVTKLFLDIFNGPFAFTEELKQLAKQKI